MPRSRRWTTDAGPEAAAHAVRGNTKWEPTLAFPKGGAHRATIGDRIFAEVHIDLNAQRARDSERDDYGGTGPRPPAPFIESVVYDYMGVQNGHTLLVRETSRQGERVERQMLHVRMTADGPTKIRFPSGVVSIAIDDEQVATVRWLGP